MNKAFLFLFITAFADCLGQDYVNNNLDCVYGKRHYQGASDAKASVRVTSHDNMIEVLVNLKDDKVFFNGDLVKSDHIELWFATDTLSRNYILDGEVYDGFNGEPVSIDGFLSYKDQLLIGQDDQQTEEDSASVSTPTLISDFTGMVHWGIDLKKKTATLFDTDRYYFLSPHDSASGFITIKSAGASSYSILIKPEALGFSTGNIISSLYMMADVFDADGPNDLSVLSTSIHRVWGKRNSFTNVTLSSPLTTGKDLNPDKVIEGGMYFFDGKQWEYYYASATSEDLRNSFCTFTYLPLSYVDEVQTLANGDKLYIRAYSLEQFSVYPESIQKIKFRDWSFHCYANACGDGTEGLLPAPGIDIKAVKKNTYAITTGSCSRRSVSGYGACGACDDHVTEYFITNGNALHAVAALAYSVNQMTVEIASVASFHGYITHAGWSEKHDAIIIDCINDDHLYSDSPQSGSSETDKKVCERYTITWDKNFKTKVKKTKLACAHGG